MAGKRRVIAYTMHEHEQAEAAARLEEAVFAEGFVMGAADDATIGDLKAKGLILRELPAPAARRRSVSGAPGTPGAAGTYVEVELREPLCEPHRQAIAAAGLELTERLDNLSFLASVRAPGAVAAASSLPYVVSITEYEAPVRSHRPARRARGRTPPAPPAPPTAGAPPLPAPAALAGAPAPSAHTYDVLLHEPGRLREVQAFAAQHGIPVLGSSARKLRVSATESQADALNQLDGVALVEEYVIPKLYNDRARSLIWPNAPANAALTGNGEIVAVADSGLDDAHPALQGRVAKTIARGRPADASDPHGHGTHVAATIAAGTGPQRGVAPGATLVFQSVMDGSGLLTGLPVELDELLEEAYDEGARIHNDSWGADLAASYTLSSLEVDRFVHAHKDMLVVVAAGNAGVGATGAGNARLGFVEWGSLGAPATSKNALVVGASRSDRTTGGLSTLTYGQVWASDFPDPPIAQANVSGDPECLAGFSSRGPCNDRRIKPDVVAPGTDVLSAKASTAPNENFAQVVSLDGARYGYMSGTSIATPVVAGVAALVREWLRTQRNHARPSAALLKALLINGTRWLGGRDANADHARLPNFHQGFGCVHLPTTIPLDASFVLAFVDDWEAPAEQLTTSGMRRRFRVQTTSPAELRITLAYTDAPGRGVQNDLSLFVEIPGRQKRLGNEDVPLALFHPDPDNNVETLRIPNAPVGSYLIQVTATTILHAPQDFALVVSGALDKSTLDPA